MWTVRSKSCWQVNYFVNLYWIIILLLRLYNDFNQSPLLFLIHNVSHLMTIGVFFLMFYKTTFWRYFVVAGYCTLNGLKVLFILNKMFSTHPIRKNNRQRHGFIRISFAWTIRVRVHKKEAGWSTKLNIRST